MLAVAGVNFIMPSRLNSIDMCNFFFFGAISIPEVAAIRLYFCRIPKFIGNVLRASFDNSFSRIDCFEVFCKEHQQVAE